MQKTNNNIDKEFEKLAKFIITNNAELLEGLTYELLLENRAKPHIDRRKLESKTLILN